MTVWGLCGDVRERGQGTTLVRECWFKGRSLRAAEETSWNAVRGTLVWEHLWRNRGA